MEYWPNTPAKCGGNPLASNIACNLPMSWSSISSGNMAAAIVAAAVAAEELWLVVVAVVLPVVLGAADIPVEFADAVKPVDDINGGKPAPAISPPLVVLLSATLPRIGILGAGKNKW